MYTKSLAKLFKKSREKRELTQKDIADLLNVNRSTISNWERGNISNMKVKYIPKLSKALQIPEIAFIYPETYTKSKALKPEYLEAAYKLQMNNIKIEELDKFIQLVNDIKKNLIFKV